MRDSREYEKHAWLILFVLGILTVISAPIALRGIPPNPPSPDAVTGMTLAQLDAQIPGLDTFIGASEELDLAGLVPRAGGPAPALPDVLSGARP